MLVRQRTSASLLSREKTTTETCGTISRSSLIEPLSGGMCGRRVRTRDGRGAGVLSGDLLQRLDDRGVGALLGDVVQHDLLDDPVAVDQHGRAVGDPLLLEVEAELLRDGALRLEVGQQWIPDP